MLLQFENIEVLNNIENILPKTIEYNNRMLGFLHSNPLTISNMCLLAATTATWLATITPYLQFFVLIIGAILGTISLLTQLGVIKPKSKVKGLDGQDL